jgi:hypothetical protein
MSDAIVAGGLTIQAPSVNEAPLNILLWGDSGSGKTTLAATAPGKKLYVLFDAGGALSLTDRDDIAVLDLTTEPAIRVMAMFRGADPYDLGKILQAHPEFETIVLDSCTALAYLALQEAVTRAGGKISLEQPGMNGYTWRNATILRIISALMQLCARYKRHFIAITHEDAPTRTAEGDVSSITMALSDSVANQVGLRLNEVWHVSDNGKERVIAVRPCRMRRPMKTRLFDATAPEFVWHYDPNTQSGEGIADWYHAWQERAGKKQPLPVRATSTTRKGVNKK